MRKAVLIVDDNIFIRHALCEFFQREPDFAVCGVAENGRDAIDEACRLHPDVIVLDFAMPVMNGLDAARIIKREIPSVQLIMYSALEDKSSEQMAWNTGFAALVSKSDKISVLIEKARGLVASKAA
ncbi:MAG TPA: response regulator [Candidatus Sulfotelmatobacter sp.]|nr:response regulator [Candidatus Sulfotelmatobacter sp.]